MKIKLLFLVMILCISCSHSNKMIEEDDKIDLTDIEIEYAVYNNQLDGKFNLELIIHYPNSIFSFIKEDERFFSKSNFYVNVLNKKTSDLKRQSFKKELYNEEYFDCANTKKINNYKLEYLLDEGVYEVTVIIKDQISKQEHKATKEIFVYEINKFSVPLLMNRNEQGDFVYVMPENFSGETLWAKIQFAINQDSKDIKDFKITYESKTKIDTVDFLLNESIFDESTQIILIPLNGILDNEYDFLVFTSDDETKKVKIDELGFKTFFWSNDIEELKGVMKYFINEREIATLDSLEDYEVKPFLNSYWLENYEDSDKLLFELKKRFQYVNEHFSNNDDGWMSARGRIYLIYGVPSSVKSWSEYSSGKGNYNEVKFETWNYNGINKSFKFVKRNYFEDFILTSNN